MKIYLKQDWYTYLDVEAIANRVELVGSADEADFVISCCEFLDAPPEKTIMVASEPPVFPGGDLARIHDTADRYHAFFYWNADDHPNATPFPVNVLSWPYDNMLSSREVRDDTTITERRVYFAGRRAEREKSVYPGRISLYKTRRKIAEELPGRGIPVTAVGRGWDVVSRSGEDLDVNMYMSRMDKLLEVSECRADFILCVENSYMSGYVTEKIHDGFRSDRVVLYLGTSDIEKYIPTTCFLDLRKWYDAGSGAFYVPGLVKYLKKMGQGEYDDIVGSARAWVKSLLGGADYKDHSESKKLMSEAILSCLGVV